MLCCKCRLHIFIPAIPELNVTEGMVEPEMETEPELHMKERGELTGPATHTHRHTHRHTKGEEVLVPGGDTRQAGQSVVASKKDGGERTGSRKTFPSQRPQDHEVQPD